MRTAVLTDTNSGISVEAGKKLGIYVLPMPVLIDGETYLEGENIDHPMLFQAMRDNRDISTSQPAPGAMIEMWDAIFADGYDELIYIPMSSGLSGSCEMAISFSREYDGRVQVADNHRISVTMYESVLDAISLVKKGKTAKEIKDLLEENAYESSIYIAVNSLKYLKKSGRVTAAGAAIATAMNIKPILTIQGGKLDAFSKVRGMKTCRKKMVDAVRKDITTRFPSVEPTRLRIGAAGTFEKEEDAIAWKEILQEAFPKNQVEYIPLSCSIACHVGIDAIGCGISCIEDR